MRGLLCPEDTHVGPCLERLEPNDKADSHRENSAEDDGVSVKSEDCATGGRGHRRYGEDESGKDEDGVDASGCRNTMVSTHGSNKEQNDLPIIGH